MKSRLLCFCLVLVISFALFGCDEKKTESSSESKSVSSETTVYSETETDISETTLSTNKTTKTKTTTATTTGTKEYNPTAVDTNNLSGYSFSMQGFNMVTSLEDFYDYIDELQKILSNCNFNISFSYENMDTGAAISFNDTKKFATCSTIKTPFVASLLKSGINLDEKVTKMVNWSGDSGIVAKAKTGTEYTAKQLIKYTIQRSDNTAYYNLVKHFGYTQFNSDLKSIGANYSLGDSWIFTYCTSADMLKCYKEIYKYGEDSKLGKWLTKLMQDTDVNRQIGKALDSKYDVSQKYGSDWSAVQYHDCAIVYADSPFVLCIFTNQYPETNQSDKIFQEIANIIDRINNVIYINK